MGHKINIVKNAPPYREIYVFEYDIVIHCTQLAAFSIEININKINKLKSRQRAHNPLVLVLNPSATN
ncbi:hypothetical protein [Legionella pneumophila]|uniref:hypothetical protein n=1 Tax=Legionella pneumophila TaxID=446 RepID=UPI00059AD960